MMVGVMAQTQSLLFIQHRIRNPRPTVSSRFSRLPPRTLFFFFVALLVERRPARFFKLQQLQVVIGKL